MDPDLLSGKPKGKKRETFGFAGVLVCLTSVLDSFRCIHFTEFLARYSSHF